MSQETKAIGSSPIIPYFTQIDETPPFLMLPVEKILEIVMPSNLATIHALKLTCRQLNVLLQDESLWKAFFQRDFPSCRLPLLENFREGYADRHRFHTNFTHGAYTTRKLKGHQSLITSLAIAEGRIFAGSPSDRIEVFNLATEESFVLTMPPGMAHNANALLAAGDRLFSCSGGAWINVHHLKTGRFEKSLTGHRHVTCLAAYGENLISGSFVERTIRIWNVDSGKSQCLEGHTEGITSLVVREDMLYSGSHDKTIRVWDLKKGEFLFVLGEHEKSVMSLAFDGENLVSGSNDAAIKVWDLKERSCLHILSNTYPVYRLASFEGKVISFSSFEPPKLWDSRQGKDLSFLNVHGAFETVFQDDKLYMIIGSDIAIGSDILILDFHAKDSEIFREIAAQLKQPREQAKAAFERFDHMPKKAKGKIYDKLPQSMGTLFPQHLSDAINAYLAEIEKDEVKQ